MEADAQDEGAPVTSLDAEVFAALRSGELSCEDVVAAVGELERLVLEQVAAEMIAKGFPEPLVRFAIDERRAAWLAERPARAATLRDMVACGATAVN
jgi:hypothetical protein